jgi:hypothetical protein
MAKKKIKIVEHGGDEHITEVENFNAKEVHEQMKAAQLLDTNDYVVCVGDVIIDARSVKSIVPVK